MEKYSAFGRFRDAVLKNCSTFQGIHGKASKSGWRFNSLKVIKKWFCHDDASRQKNGSNKWFSHVQVKIWRSAWFCQVNMQTEGW